jgi:hypothetical protein
LRNLAGIAGVSDAVHFVIDPSDDQLRSLIGEASYFGCLSAYEGFGLAAVEAMSAGLSSAASHPSAGWWKARASAWSSMPRSPRARRSWSSPWR